MRFSLKTMLIGFVLASAALGWMGRLWVENPERFFFVLTIATTIGPFLLAVGTLIWLGFRRKMSASVHVAAWGVFLLLTPALGGLARIILLPNGRPIRVLSAKRLIEQRLPGKIDQPMLWRELEYRANCGELNKQEADSAVSLLIAHMKKGSSRGGSRQLTWKKDFLRIILQKRLISDEVLLELCEVYHGTQPKLNPLSPYPPGSFPLELRVEYGNSWDGGRELGVVLVWHVNSISLNGEPLLPQQVNKHSHQIGVYHCTADLPAGDHEIVVEVECAFIDEEKFLGLDSLKVTPAQWPEARKRWKTQIRAPLLVEP